MSRAIVSSDRFKETCVCFCCCCCCHGTMEIALCCVLGVHKSRFGLKAAANCNMHEGESETFWFL